MTILYICILACFAYLSWQKIENGILLIAAGLPSYLIRFPILGIPTTVLELAILILAVIWMVKDSRWKRINWHLQKNIKVENPIPPSLRLPLALILMSAFLGMLWSPDQAHAFGIFKAYFIEPMIFMIIMVYEIKTSKQVEKIIRVLGIAVIVLGILGLLQYITGWGIGNPSWAAVDTRRATSIYGYPNAASLFVGPIIGLYAAYLLNFKSRIQQSYKLLVILAGITVIVTAKTAGAIIGIGIALWALTLIMTKKRKLLLTTTIIIAIGLSIIAAQNLRFNQIAHNITSNHLDLASTSFEIRANQWRETLQMLIDRPITGAGLAGYQSMLDRYHRYEWLEIYLYPHNIFLNFWSELGILGVVAFVWLMILTFKSLIPIIRDVDADEIKKTYAIALLLAWIVILVHGLVDVPYFKNDLSVLYMMLVGMTIIVKGIDAKREKLYSA